MYVIGNDPMGLQMLRVCGTAPTLALSLLPVSLQRAAHSAWCKTADTFICSVPRGFNKRFRLCYICDRQTQM